MDANADRFPVWDGELYLQYHRGTLTSVARNKANNRRAEREMKELEYLCAMATVLSRDVPYPSAKIAEFWDIILINQFHDILPGTSIAEVYKDSDAEYDSLFAALESANGPRQVAAAALSKPNAGQLTLFNFTSQNRDAELVNFVGHAKALQVGRDKQAMQKVFGADGTVGSCAPMPRVPPLGWATAQLSDVSVPIPQTKLSVSTSHLENDFLKVVFDKAGEITSVIDKLHERELIAPGKTANALIAYEDKPRHWDAWDIDRSFDEQFWPLANEPKNIEVLETGPYRAAIRIERTYASSKIVQVISLQDGARQVEFDTYIDWQERQTLLKTLFPLDLNTSEIRSEVQFGHVVRATHRNTSWDQARYEASMHRWVDMSEPDFGAALLNDCKYGYDAVGQMVRMTLLKSPVDPYPDADLGEHRMRYALKLHDGLFDLAQVVLAAERFNNPISVIGETRLMAGETDHKPASFSFANVDRDNVTLETLKKAQDGADLILRVFEHANKRTSATIKFGIPIAKVQKVNLMEEGGDPVAVIDNAVTLDLRPFEISTLRITPI
ncbi:MAG: hypothetical protein GXP05_15140 [Alphaproteobacteria bacterium]|nr:hypothetical protein [Alphaproteobacteria bacterium]